MTQTFLLVTTNPTDTMIQDLSDGNKMFVEDVEWAFIKYGAMSRSIGMLCRIRSTNSRQIIRVINVLKVKILIFYINISMDAQSLEFGSRTYFITILQCKAYENIHIITLKVFKKYHLLIKVI